MVHQNDEEDDKSIYSFENSFVITIKILNYLDSKIENIGTQDVQVFIVLDQVDDTKAMEEIDRNYHVQDVETNGYKTLLVNTNDILVISIQKKVEDNEKNIEDLEDNEKVKVVVAQVKLEDDGDSVVQSTMQVEIVKSVEINMIDEIEAPNQTDVEQNYLCRFRREQF